MGEKMNANGQRAQKAGEVHERHATVTFLSAADVMRRFGISSTTLWRWLRTGRFPKPRYTPGGHRRWANADLERWAAALPTDRACFEGETAGAGRCMQDVEALCAGNAHGCPGGGAPDPLVAESPRQVT